MIPWNQSTQDPHDTFIPMGLSLNYLEINNGRYGSVQSASPFSFIVDPFVPLNQWRPISALSPESHHSMSTICIDDDSMASINSGPPRYLRLSLNYLEINNGRYELHCFPSSLIPLCLQINGVPSLCYLPNLTIACRRFALTMIPWNQSTQDHHNSVFVLMGLSLNYLKIDGRYGSVQSASPFSFVVDPFVASKSMASYLCVISQISP